MGCAAIGGVIFQNEEQLLVKFQMKQSIALPWFIHDSKKKRALLKLQNTLCLYIKGYRFLKNIFCYSITVVPNFPPLPSSAQPTPQSHSQSPLCCPCPWVFHTCSLTNLFPFFPPLPLSPLVIVDLFPCFHASGSTLLVCLFCSLGSCYRWDHRVFVFCHLAYFT